MPAVSKQQQKLMGIVHGIQKGTVDPKDVSSKAASMAKTMKPGEVTKYASTKHKGLPKKVKKEGQEDGQISEVYAVVAPYLGCTPDSLVKPIDPLNGISGTEISPDQVHGVYSGADQAMMIAERMCAEYEEGQRVLEEKKGTTTEKLKKAIDKLEKKRKEHMDAMKEDPKNASEHKAAIADLATKIDDYITKLEKIEKSKKAEEKKEKEDKKDKKSLKEGEQRAFKIKVIRKDGRSTIETVYADPETTELFNIVALMKKSKNIKDVKFLDTEE